MDRGNIAQRLLHLLITFALLRAAEACFSVVALVFTDYALGQASPNIEQRLLTRADFSGSWTIAQTYYVSFGYIYFSAIAFLLAELVFGGVARKRMLVIANLGALLVHSLAVIALVFAGRIGIYLWAVWFEVVVFNWLMAGWLWKLRFVREANERIRASDIR
jgi:hypothetical protein